MALSPPTAPRSHSWTRRRHRMAKRPRRPRCFTGSRGHNRPASRSRASSSARAARIAFVICEAWRARGRGHRAITSRSHFHDCRGSWRPRCLPEGLSWRPPVFEPVATCLTFRERRSPPPSSPATATARLTDRRLGQRQGKPIGVSRPTTAFPCLIRASYLRPEWRNGSSRLPGGVPWAPRLGMVGHGRGQDVETLRDDRTGR